MIANSRKRMTLIHDPTEIPQFVEEAQEHRFWSTHDLSAALIAAAEPIPDGELPPPRAPTNPIPIYLDDDAFQRVQSLAAHRGLRYQKMIQQFVLERLAEEEQRERSVGARKAHATS